MKGTRIVVGARRTRYAPLHAREPLATPRVAGGGIFETDAVERVDAASRREERHASFEANRETVPVSIGTEKHGAARRFVRRVKERLWRKL